MLVRWQQIPSLVDGPPTLQFTVDFRLLIAVAEENLELNGGRLLLIGLSKIKIFSKHQVAEIDSRNCCDLVTLEFQAETDKCFHSDTTPLKGLSFWLVHLTCL